MYKRLWSARKSARGNGVITTTKAESVLAGRAEVGLRRSSGGSEEQGRSHSPGGDVTFHSCEETLWHLPTQAGAPLWIPQEACSRPFALENLEPAATELRTGMWAAALLLTGEQSKLSRSRCPSAEECTGHVRWHD